MDSWIPKKKIVRFAATAALFSIILYSVGLLVIFGETKRIENLYNDTSSNSFKEEKFLATKSIAEANRGPIQTLRDFFIQKGDEVKFIEEVEKVAQTSSVKFEIASIDVKTNEGDSFKEDVDVRVSIKGSWTNTIYFMDRLKKMPFGISIERADLNINTPGDWSGLIEFVVFREK